MKIGIDISQLAHEGTGVATYVKSLVEELLIHDTKNEYVLFYSSLRKILPESRLWFAGGKIKQDILPNKASITIVQYKMPPAFLELLWNRWHIFPIEKFTGPLDVFLSSDWVQPPSKAKKVTILYDLIVYKYPEETDKKIISVQKRKLKWVKKEVDKIICISEATKKDAMEILSLPEERLTVIYPGF